MNSVGILAPSILLVVIGALFSSIVGSNVYGAIDPFQNKVDIVTDSKHKNDCDEYDAGANSADCSNVDETTADQISMIGKNNKFISNINVDQIQKCDETRSGNNNAECTNNSSNFLDSIAVIGKDNKINYGIDTKQVNDCGDTKNGDDNNSPCLNDLQNVINSLTVTGDNTPIEVHVSTGQSNNCDDKTSNDNTLICKNIHQNIETP